MIAKPQQVKSIFRWNDNKTIDYSVLFADEHLEIHSAGEKAVSTFEDGKPVYMKGEQIDWTALPEFIQNHIVERVA